MKSCNVCSHTAQHIAELAVVALISLSCGCCPGQHNHGPISSKQHLAGSDEDLWAYENGYLCLRSRVAWPSEDDVKCTVFVFDLNVLEQAHRMWASARDAKATSGFGIRTHDTAGHEATRFGVEFAEASRFMVRAAKEHPEKAPRLVAAVRLSGTWCFCELSVDDGCLVRELIPREDRDMIMRWFWPVFENGRLRDDREFVSWDDLHPLYRKKTITRIGEASVRFLIRWNGREYVGAGIKDYCGDERILAIPGLGAIGTGDCRPATPIAERKMGSCAVHVIVPSRGVEIYNPMRKIDILKMMLGEKGE